jgi:hypothetical protein
MAVQMVGTVNGYVTSPMMFGRKRAMFNGTTLGLIETALKMGAVAGSRIKADFGAGMQAYEIKLAPHDPRAEGFWVERV